MAYDPVFGAVILYGGLNFSDPYPYYQGILGDLWGFRNGTWTPFDMDGPPGHSRRWGAMMAYNPSALAIQLVDGYWWDPVNNTGPIYLRDCWYLEGSHLYWGQYAAGASWVPCGNTTGPGARAFGGMAYDENDGYMLLFGGQGPSGMLGDTWTFSPSGTWTQLHFGPGQSPSARSNFTMTYDSSNMTVVLNGGAYYQASQQSPNSLSGGSPLGSGSTIIVYNDTWAFSRGIWTISPPPGPGIGIPGYRFLATSTYDAIDAQQIEFGGVPCFYITYQGCTLTVQNVWFQSLSAQGDTWTFSGGPLSLWKLHYPFPAPPPVFGAAMAYDANDGMVVFFGGASWVVNHEYIGAQTWTYWGGSWSAVYPANRTTLLGWHNDSVGPIPSLRNSSGMADDVADGYSLVFGGHNKGQNLNDTWAYVSGRWSNLTGSASPPLRYGAVMTYDAEDSYVLLFGGRGGTNSTSLNDTWSYAHGAWAALTPSCWNGTRIPAVPGPCPSPRVGAAVAYDSNISRVVMFGGTTWTPPPFATQTYFGDTWEYLNRSWTLVVGSNGVHPSARSNASLGFYPSSSANRSRGYEILFGGYNSNQFGSYTFYNDTWIFVGGSWRQLSPNRNPGNRSAAQLSIDGVDSSLLLSGGTVCAGVPKVCSVKSDAWAFSNGNWSQVTTSGTIPTRANGAAVWDSRDRLELVAGGTPGSLNPWVYLNRGWLNATPSALPLPGSGAAGTAYNGPSRYVLTSGGSIKNWTTGILPPNTWTIAQGRATNITSSLTVLPNGTTGSSMVYDELDGYVILFGGLAVLYTPEGVPYDLHSINQTWVFQNGQWSNRTPALSPPSRSFAGMAYDPVDGYVVLFGGYNYSNGLYSAIHDTWTYKHGLWHHLNLVTYPTQRAQAMMSFDAAIGAVVLYGGWGCAQSRWNGNFDCNDTWLFQGGNWTRVFPLAKLYPSVLGIEQAEAGYSFNRQAFFVTGGDCIYGINDYEQACPEGTWTLQLVWNGSWPGHLGYGHWNYTWANITNAVENNMKSTADAPTVEDFEARSSLIYEGFVGIHNSRDTWELV